MAFQRALITGITGQDGSYLAELLLSKGYEVHGLVRPESTQKPSLLLPFLDRITLHRPALENSREIAQCIAAIEPHECYHLAAHTFVSYSLEDEFSAVQANITGTHNVLAAVKSAAPACRFCFAGSSEMFGNPEESPQSEATRFRPRSIYGITKVAGFELTKNYREASGIHASSAILYNHESPRRGLEFVTRKISHGVAQIAGGSLQRLELGNLDAERDWGHAAEYVEAMWRILQQDQPGDYVLATGKTHTVREFVEIAFAAAGLNYERYVSVNPHLLRPAEDRQLVGDASKAWEQLQWRPVTQFSDLVREMVESDCRLLQAQL
ncbi:MAG: GDP-mannose 4,6-dehydratase [Bryobacteraceae bacterium]